MRAAVTSTDDTQYWEYVLLYVDDALCQGGDRNVENFTIPLQFESFVSKESFDDTNLVAESDFDIFQTAIFDLGLYFEEMQTPSDRLLRLSPMKKFQI